MPAAFVDRYLDRIALPPQVATDDLPGLARLQRAHMAAVPFENLDIVFAGGVPHDRQRAVDKILGSHRGGWCFELNGAFALLLEALGFEVMLLGAAVLLGGPSTVIDHVALEVSGGRDRLEPHLVDVGFGDGFHVPLPLNSSGPLSGGSGDFEFLSSPQGTTLTEHVDGVPEARFRFKRVAHRFDDFAAVAASMQTDPNKHWSSKPFATRLLDATGSDRVTLTHDRLKVRRDGVDTVVAVDATEWDGVLDDWFGIERPRAASADGDDAGG